MSGAAVARLLQFEFYRVGPIWRAVSLRSGMESLKPEEAAVLALLRGRLAKEAEGSRGQRAA
jgi:hypothetical protein